MRLSMVTLTVLSLLLTACSKGPPKDFVSKTIDSYIEARREKIPGRVQIHSCEVLRIEVSEDGRSARAIARIRATFWDTQWRPAAAVDYSKDNASFRFSKDEYGKWHFRGGPYH